jgi:hypothetical protein
MRSVFLNRHGSADHHEAILGMLTDEQKETPQKFCDYKPQNFLGF